MPATTTLASASAFIDAAESSTNGSSSALVILGLTIAVVVLLGALGRNAAEAAGVLALMLGCIARALGAMVTVVVIVVLLVLAIAGGGSARATDGEPGAPTTAPTLAPVDPSGGAADAPPSVQPTR